MFKPRSVLAMHDINYSKRMKKLKAKDEDYDTINRTIESLQKYPIKCYRYSNKLADQLHIPEKYNAKIQLS